MTTPPVTLALKFARGITILAARFGEHFVVSCRADTVSAGCENDGDAVPFATVNDAERDELESLGWEWAEKYESWVFAL